MNKFQQGQQVIIKHQPDLGVMIVENGFEPIEHPFSVCGKCNNERVLVTGYVRVGNGRLTGLGYWESNLEGINS